MIQPYGRIYDHAAISGRASVLHAILRPWAVLLDRFEPKREAKRGRVSGIYYPID